MVIKYQMSADATRLEDIIVRIWEAQSDGPGAEVWEQTYVEKNGAGVPTPGAGHQVIETVIANGLDKVVHIVRAIGATSGDIIHEYTAEPKTDTVIIFDPIQFKIGDGGDNTPDVDTTTYINTILIGVTKYLIHRNNYGFLILGTHYTRDTGAGAFDLIAPDKFEEDEEFTLMLQPTALTTVVNDSVVAKYFSGFVDIVADTVYNNAAHLRKLLRLSGSVKYTFQAADSIPIGYGFCFTTFGSAGTARIEFLNGQLKWGGTPKTYIDLPMYSEICVSWDGVNWNVVWLTKSDFIADVGVTPGTILGTGEVHIGDIPPGDYALSITHNLGIVGDYNVMLSIKTTAASYGTDNKIGYAWWHDTTGAKANKFNITLQEIVGEIQNIDLVWLIIKK